MFAAQCVYSLVMLLCAAGALALWRHIHLHPQLCDTPMSLEVYRAARVRTGMLMVVSLVACLIAWVVPGAGNAAFMLMALGGRYHTMFELQAQRFNAAEDEEGVVYDVLA